MSDLLSVYMRARMSDLASECECGRDNLDYNIFNNDRAEREGEIGVVLI